MHVLTAWGLCSVSVVPSCIIVSLIGWTDLARVVRGKLLSLREEDFVMAGRIAGTTDPAIVTRHLIPSFLSYVIVALTLSVPSMIRAATSLSVRAGLQLRRRRPARRRRPLRLALILPLAQGRANIMNHEGDVRLEYVLRYGRAPSA